MSGPPLAGRPPFATDEPDSYYSSPSSSSAPQQRTRFHIPSPHEERVNANKRTSAYDVYDNYLAAPSSSSGPSSSSSSSSNPFANPTSSSSNNTTSNNSNRDSGIGALLMSLDDSDSDSDSDESPAPRSKNAALAAAVSSNSNANSSSGTGPTPNAHRHNPFTNPQGQGQGQQQQQKQRQSRNPFETPPLQVQSRSPSGQPQMQQQQQQTQRTVLAAPQPGYAAPIAALNLGQLTASAGSMPVPPQAAMTRQPQPPMPGMSMAMPAPVSMPHPHPHQHAPKGPPSNLQINTSIPLPMPAHSPFTPITPFTPGGAPFDPSRVASPHPLLPPVTPIVPAFVKPLASSVKGGKKGGAAPTPKPVGFDESVFGGKQGGGEEKERQSVETLDDEQGYPIPAPRRRGSGDGAGAGHGNAPGGAGGKGDEFWRRFSMVVKERERGRAAGKESSWLHETLSNSSRHTRSISVVAFFLVVLIAAGIGCGVYFTRNAPGHQQPKLFGGGAGNVATDTVGEGGATGKGGVGAGTKTVLHVSPTFTIDGRGWEEEVGVVPTPTPAMMPTPAVSPTVVVVDEEKGRSNASSSSRNHGSEQQLKRWKRRHEGGWKNRLGLVLEEGVF